MPAQNVLKLSKFNITLWSLIKALVNAKCILIRTSITCFQKFFFYSRYKPSQIQVILFISPPNKTPLKDKPMAYKWQFLRQFLLGWAYANHNLDLRHKGWMVSCTGPNGMRVHTPWATKCHTFFLSSNDHNAYHSHTPYHRHHFQLHLERNSAC